MHIHFLHIVFHRFFSRGVWAKKQTLHAVLSLVIAISFVFCSKAQNNAAQRYEIDAKRLGVDPTGQDALPRSREFIRLDSTYYVGWMYEGLFKFDRSADLQGYQLAIVPLERAIALLNDDFGENLRLIYSNRTYFSQYVQRYQDLLQLCGALAECYDNIERPDKTMALCDFIDAFGFAKDYFGTDGRRAWTFHRFRASTDARFPFLQNTIAGNEQRAFYWSYHALAKIAANAPINDQMFGPTQALSDQLPIYHNLALLHTYNNNYDSSEYYYQILAKYGQISWNNYAGMQMELGNFRSAMENFRKDLYGGNDHALKEPAYFIPTLLVFAGQPIQAIEMTRQTIQKNGSMPGFGWYNIALARSYLYNNQLDSSQWALDKATNFKEVHIGTSLTQGQYDFTARLLQLQLYDRSIAQEKFAHKRWYFSFGAIFKIVKLTFKKILAEYAIADILSHDPDREKLFYELFCSESTTTFDENWYLMKDFGLAYLQKKYQGYIDTGKRPHIQRYFQLFEARLTLENGEVEAARQQVEWLIAHVKVDTETEKLFLGRLYETAALIYQKEGNRKNADFYVAQLLATYPQLLPASELRPRMRLQILGLKDATTDRLLDALHRSNMQWTEDADVPQLQLYVSQSTDKKYQVIFKIVDNKGQVLLANNPIVVNEKGELPAEMLAAMFSK